jgi:hypothetical protein
MAVECGTGQHPSMSDESIRRVNRLIREFKEQSGAAGTTPEDICRHVALALEVSEDTARALILEAGRRGANPSPPGS